jgi:hypothetical protein
MARPVVESLMMAGAIIGVDLDLRSPCGDYDTISAQKRRIPLCGEGGAYCPLRTLRFVTGLVIQFRPPIVVVLARSHDRRELWPQM